MLGIFLHALNHLEMFFNIIHVQAFCRLFKIRLFGFVLLICRSSLYRLGTRPVSDTHIVSISFQCMACPFPFLLLTFHEQKFLVLMYLFSSFYGGVFYSLIKKSLPTPRS